MTAPADRYVLSLDDIPRPVLTFNGHDYELASPDDYPIADIKIINRLWKECMDWSMADSVSKKDSDEYEKHLDRLVTYCCPDLPVEVKQHKNFKRSVKESIIISFLAEANRNSPLVRMTQQVTETTTSEPSQSSLGSTEASSITGPDESLDET